MINDDIVIDLVHAEDPGNRQQLIAASYTYWENKGYACISNVAGPDMLRGYKGILSGGGYDPGRTIFSLNADVILIFQKQG